MGKSQWLPVERKHLQRRRFEWAFGGVAVGASKWMSMGPVHLFLCRQEWAFGGAAVGKSERMSMELIDNLLGPWTQRSVQLGDREWISGEPVAEVRVSNWKGYRSTHCHNRTMLINKLYNIMYNNFYTWKLAHFFTSDFFFVSYHNFSFELAIPQLILTDGEVVSS